MSEQRDITIQRMKDAYNKACETSERWEDHFGAALDVALAENTPSLPSGGDVARYRELAIQRIIRLRAAKGGVRFSAHLSYASMTFGPVRASPRTTLLKP